MTSTLVPLAAAFANASFTSTLCPAAAVYVVAVPIVAPFEFKKEMLPVQEALVLVPFAARLVTVTCIVSVLPIPAGGSEIECVELTASWPYAAVNPAAARTLKMIPRLNIPNPPNAPDARVVLKQTIPTPSPFQTSIMKPAP